MKNMDDLFCPLIKDYCRKDCICYRPKETKIVKIQNFGGCEEVEKTTKEYCIHFKGN